MHATVRRPNKAGAGVKRADIHRCAGRDVVPRPMSVLVHRMTEYARVRGTVFQKLGHLLP